MASPDGKPSINNGKWVVILILALGVLGGTAAVIYWVGVDRRTFPTTQPGAGALPWDEAEARKELRVVRERFDSTAGKGSLSAVLRDATTLVEHYPKYAAGHSLLAQVLLFDKQYAAAYEQLEMSLQIDPRQASTHSDAGVIANQLGRIEDAAKHHATSVSLAPREVGYRVLLANTYIKLKDFDRARDTVLEALNVDSSFHEGYALLGDIYAKQGKVDLAIEQMQKAIEHTPLGQRPKQVNYIRAKAGMLRRDNRPEEALQALRSLSAEERMSPSVLDDMARTWSQMNEFGEAAKVYEGAAKADKFEWRYPADAARMWMRAGDKKAAERNIAAIRKINPKLDIIQKLEAELAAMK